MTTQTPPAIFDRLLNTAEKACHTFSHINERYTHITPGEPIAVYVWCAPKKVLRVIRGAAPHPKIKK